VGLGLAVAHRIATACGGAITVRSPTGTGARFEVRLPIATPVVAEAATTRPEHARLAAALGPEPHTV
jgi:K+-sensing histidine kinase KdpD